MGITIRPIADDEGPDFLRAVDRAFSSEISDEGIEGELHALEAGRAIAAYDGDRIVGTAGARTFELTVPGRAQVPCAGVSYVGVAATHRRQGILRALMAEQLDDIAARGEPVAALLASEAAIYGRFGFGHANDHVRWRVDTRRASFRDGVAAGGRLRFLDEPEDERQEILAAIYDRYRRQQPGELSRSGGYWKAWRLHPSKRGNRFDVVCDGDDGQPAGFATYTAKLDWHGMIPDGHLDAVIVAADPITRLRLWRFLCEVDLVTTVTAVVPPDDPLPWALEDRRALRVDQVDDHLWVRIVDVAAALAARSYPADGELVLELADPILGANTRRWRLAVAGGVGMCEPAGDAAADLSGSIDALGSLYLGGVPATALCAAGRLQEARAGAAGDANRLFAADPPPFTLTGF